MHQADHVVEMAEKYRIGNLDKRDIELKTELMRDDSYQYEPVRHPAMIPNSLKPWCSEAPGAMLAVRHFFLIQ